MINFLTPLNSTSVNVLKKGRKESIAGYRYDTVKRDEISRRRYSSIFELFPRRQFTLIALFAAILHHEIFLENLVRNIHAISSAASRIVVPYTRRDYLYRVANFEVAHYADEKHYHHDLGKVGLSVRATEILRFFLFSFWFSFILEIYYTRSMRTS